MMKHMCTRVAMVLKGKVCSGAQDTASSRGLAGGRHGWGLDQAADEDLQADGEALVPGLGRVNPVWNHRRVQVTPGQQQPVAAVTELDVRVFKRQCTVHFLGGEGGGGGGVGVCCGGVGQRGCVVGEGRGVWGDVGDLLVVMLPDARARVVPPSR